MNNKYLKGNQMKEFLLLLNSNKRNNYQAEQQIKMIGVLKQMAFKQ